MKQRFQRIGIIVFLVTFMLSGLSCTRFKDAGVSHLREPSKSADKVFYSRAKNKREEFHEETSDDGAADEMQSESGLVSGVAFAKTLDQKLITNVSMELVVKNTDRAVEELEEIMRRHQGYLGGMNRISVDGVRSASITLRIPQERLSNVLDDIKNIGRVTNEKRDTEDVSEEYTDLDSRVRNLRNTERRFTEILAMAKNVDEVLSVEAELTRIRGEIEQIEGRLRYLDNKVGFSEVTLEIGEKERPKPGEKHWALGKTVKAAVQAFLNTLEGLVKAAIWIGAYSPLILPVILIIILIRRRRRKRAGDI